MNTLTRQSKWVAVLAMVGSAACWGGATVMSRDLLEHFSPPGLLLVQLVASVLMLLLLALPQRPWRWLSPALARASWTGLLEPGMTYSIGLWGLSLTSAGNASIIGSTEPILIVLLAWLLFNKRPSRRLAAVHCDCIKFRHGWRAQKPCWGCVDCALHSVCGELCGVFLVLASAQQMVGLIYAALLYLSLHWAGQLERSLNEPSLALLVCAALSGVVQYALAFWLYLIGLKTLSPGAAALWLTLIPIFGVSGAYFWLGETPTIPMLLGMALILAAVNAGRREQ